MCPMKYLSISAKKLCACLLITSGFGLSAFGNIYSGIITQTITATNDSNFFIGETFTSSYQYESLSVDGLFGVPDRYHDSAQNTLQGSLFNWNPHVAGGVVEDTINNFGSFLTISNGCVTGFSYDGEYSFGQFWFSDCSFAWDGYFPFQTGIVTTGSLSFSAPTSTTVPEGAISTITLLTMGLLGLRFTRHRLVAK